MPRKTTSAIRLPHPLAPHPHQHLAWRNPHTHPNNPSPRYTLSRTCSKPPALRHNVLLILERQTLAYLICWCRAVRFDVPSLLGPRPSGARPLTCGYGPGGGAVRRMERDSWESGFGEVVVCVGWGLVWAGVWEEVARDVDLADGV
jgi:hypothetical protein